jgi:hypothetical protein
LLPNGGLSGTTRLPVAPGSSREAAARAAAQLQSPATTLGVSARSSALPPRKSGAPRRPPGDARPPDQFARRRVGRHAGSRYLNDLGASVWEGSTAPGGRCAICRTTLIAVEDRPQTREWESRRKSDLTSAARERPEREQMNVSLHDVGKARVQLRLALSVKASPPSSCGPGESSAARTPPRVAGLGSSQAHALRNTTGRCRFPTLACAAEQHTGYAHRDPHAAVVPELSAPPDLTPQPEPIFRARHGYRGVDPDGLARLELKRSAEA